MHSPLVVSLAALALVSFPPFFAAQDTSVPAYREEVIAVDGKPRFKITNDSKSPIVAFVMVQLRSLSTLEGRFYYDACTTAKSDGPIAPGAFATEALGYFEGADLSKVRAEARAVILPSRGVPGGL